MPYKYKIKNITKYVINISRETSLVIDSKNSFVYSRLYIHRDNLNDKIKDLASLIVTEVLKFNILLVQCCE